MDHTPRKFTPEALEIAKELMNLHTPAEFLIDTVKELAEIKDEVRKELAEQAKKMRKIAQDGEKRMVELKNRSQKAVKDIGEKHDSIMQRLREAQPELKTIEFKVNIEDGTFTPTHERDLSTPLRPEDTAREENLSAAKDMVNELFDRLKKKK